MSLPKPIMARVKIRIIAKIPKAIINKSMIANVITYMRMREKNTHLKIW